MLDKKTMDIKEIMVVLGISRSLAYKLLREEKLPVIRLGRKVLVPSSAVEKLLSAGA